MAYLVRDRIIAESIECILVLLACPICEPEDPAHASINGSLGLISPRTGEPEICFFCGELHPGKTCGDRGIRGGEHLSEKGFINHILSRN